MEIKSSTLPDHDLVPSWRWPLLAACSTISAEVLLRGFVPSAGALDSVGRMVVVFVSIYLIHRFSIFALRGYKPTMKDQLTMTGVMVGQLLIISFGRLLTNSVSVYLGEITLPGMGGAMHAVDPGFLHYAIPYAAGGVLLNALLGLQAGLVFGVCLAMLLTVYTPGWYLIGPFVVATTFIGCFSMVRFRSRSAYVKAGFNVSVIAIPFALCSVLIHHQYEPLAISVQLVAALLGGVLTGFVVGGVAPVLEYLGGYVTDISLLEMATLDHPLLKDLSIQAPGTWNHSMVMGMMSESAAREIGANPVLTRVGAYFHDIGKVKNPLYFVENQGRGENRHDKLSSSMSALIIRSHVKDGIKLAKQHKLPKAIVDMIPQHHGTSVIEYFYEKARKEAEEAGEGQEVDRSHYTYPGPKPQTREAGILMLADGIEAAARTISDPTHDRIQGLVQKMINKVFASGELNECELTLKDLHYIAKSFTRVLSGIYHQRIAYAEPAEKVSDRSERSEEESEEKAPESAAIATAEPEGKGKGESEKKKSKKEDLKRLGMS